MQWSAQVDRPRYSSRWTSLHIASPLGRIHPAGATFPAGIEHFWWFGPGEPVAEEDGSQWPCGAFIYLCRAGPRRGVAPRGPTPRAARLGAARESARGGDVPNRTRPPGRGLLADRYRDGDEHQDAFLSVVG